MDDYFDLLAQAAADVCLNPKTLSEFLSLMARLPALTPDNVLLVQQQYPDATILGGIFAWKQNYRRKLADDAKGIVILKPQVAGLEDYAFASEDEEGITGNDDNKVSDVAYNTTGVVYRPVNVYDMSQTVESENSVPVGQEESITAEQIISGFRMISDCDVETVQDKSEEGFDDEDGVLKVATTNKGIIAQACILNLCSQFAHGLQLTDDVSVQLISECAAEVICRRNFIGVPSEPMSLEQWVGDAGKNRNQYMELLNQIWLVVSRVNNEIRHANYLPVLFSFHEISLLNQLLSQPNGPAVNHRLEELKQHTEIPSLIDACESLRSKLLMLDSEGKIPKMYRDRCNKKIVTLPRYSVAVN